MLTHLPNGDLVLPCIDPAVQKVRGWRRHILAADLGQAHDFTALVGITDEAVPEWSHGMKQTLGPRTLTVSFADKFRGVSYVDVVQHLVLTMNRPPFIGRTQLAIDGTSLGRVVSDQLTDAKQPHLAVTMTAGQGWTRKGFRVNAAKTTILETLSVAFASGDLTFAHDLAMKDEIVAELETFALETTAAGNQIITQARSASGHGDAAIALGIATFVAQYLQPGFVGSAPVRHSWRV
jgi:hypothetical protein